MTTGTYRFSDLQGTRYEWARQGKHPRLYVLGEKPEDRVVVGKRGNRKHLRPACFEPQTMEVLGCFLHHGSVELSKEVIEKEAWPDTTPDITALQGRVGYIRRLLFDQPDENGASRIIETIDGYGYKFLLPVDSPVQPLRISEVLRNLDAAPDLVRLPFAPVVEHDQDLAAALNSRFHLNDPDFGNQLLQYLVEVCPKGVYCRDLHTTFTFDNPQPGKFKYLVSDSDLLKDCFHLTIKETVTKVCIGQTLRFKAFLGEQMLAEHISRPDDFDFVWCIDLPDDFIRYEDFDGDPRNIFMIDWIKVRTTQLEWQRVNTDNPREFVFEANISKLVATGTNAPLLELSYQFQTLKAKTFRHVSYGTRFLTKGMVTRVILQEDKTHIKSGHVSPYFSGLDKLEPEHFRFDNRVVETSGWLLPRSGVSFMYRYDDAHDESKHPSGVLIHERDDATASRYASSRHPLLKGIRDTHGVRSEIGDEHSDDPETYEFLKTDLTAFLTRPQTRFTFVIGHSVDAEYIEMVVSSVKGAAQALNQSPGEVAKRITCYRLRNSKSVVTNFLLLDYKSGESEVVYGGGQHSEGAYGKVFRSTHSTLVNEFDASFENLCQPEMSEQVPLRSLLQTSDDAFEEISLYTNSETSKNERAKPDFTVFRDIDAFWCPEMVVLPRGEFLMGSPHSESQRFADEVFHNELIKRRFAIGRYAVTFEEYDHFCRAARRQEPDDEGWGRGKRPVINVSWHDAKLYLNWLSEQTGNVYRLPSETEWEYACRAGTTTAYAFGDRMIPEHANYAESKLGRTRDVGQYNPNRWGLFDMHGNVWEWCADHYSTVHPPDNTRAYEGSITRGGAWSCSRRYLRSAFRHGDPPIYRDYDLGFRCVRVLK